MDKKVDIEKCIFEIVRHQRAIIELRYQIAGVVNAVEFEEILVGIEDCLRELIQAQANLDTSESDELVCGMIM